MVTIKIEQKSSKHVKQEAASKAMVPLHTKLFRLSSPKGYAKLVARF